MTVPVGPGGIHWHWCAGCQRPSPHEDPRCRGAPSPEHAEPDATRTPLDIARPRLCGSCSRLAWKSRMDGFVLGLLLGLVISALLVGLLRLL